jgi:gas vesicle protein
MHSTNPMPDSPHFVGRSGAAAREESASTRDIQGSEDLLSSARKAFETNKRRPIVAQSMIPKGNYFLMGLGIGSLIGVLFAPRSGEQTRKYVVKSASDGNELARKKVRELRDRAEDTVAHGKELIAQTEGRIAAAIDIGLKTYNREKVKALVG